MRKLLVDEDDVFRRRRPREDIPPVCAFRGRRDNVSLPQKKKVHRAVEMDATALFEKWSARSYPDWECATDVRGWRCVHDARLRQVGEVGLIIFVPQVPC